MKKFISLNAKTAGKFRKMNANGRQHVVVQAVAIEGDSVMNRLFYPSDVVTANYSKLKGVLAPLSHPRIDGEHVSASDPLAINAYGIGGFVKSPRLSEKQAVAEIWIDQATAESTTQGQRVLNAIKNGESIGVSTGLYVESEAAENQDDYDRVVTNFDVDHLAILLDEAPAGDNTYMLNEEQTVNKELLINSLIASGALDETKKDQYMALNEEALADLLKPAEPEQLALNAEEIELYANHKSDINAHLDSLKVEREKIVNETSEKTGVSVNALKTMDFEAIKKLHESVTKAKPVDNSLRNPEPSGSDKPLTLREGS